MPDPGVENCAPCHPKKHDHCGPCDPCAPKIYESEACGHTAKTCHEFSCMPPIAPVCENLGCHDDVYSSQREVLRKVNDVVGRMNAMNDKACGTFAKLEAISRQNGSYYPERVIKVTEAYSAEDDCPYKITEIRNKDCGCKPVHMQLHIAYNNTTNSELKESIFEASEIELADKMVAAIPVRAGGWFGKVRYQGAPLPGDEQDNLYTVAFTKSGRMKWYKNTVSDDQIRRDKISNSMGVYGIIAIDGQLSSTELRANIPNANQKSARVCMGQNYETGSIFILTCGGWEAEQGMYTHTAGEILAGYGCNVAVELCSGADACATDKGAMMFTPDGGKVPQLYAYWYVSRKCSFTSDFQKEIAKLMQKYGQTLHNLKLHELRLNAIDEVLQDHEQRLEVAEEKIVALEAEILIINERISVLETQINEVFERIIILETALNALTIRVENIEDDVSKLQSDLLKEIQDRIAGDEGLQAQINNIMSAIASINELILAINETLVTLIQSVTELKNQVLQLEIRLNEHESRIIVLEQGGGGEGGWQEARIASLEDVVMRQGINIDVNTQGITEIGNKAERNRQEIFGEDATEPRYIGLLERVENLENAPGPGGDWNETRIVAIEDKNTEQDARIDALEAGGTGGDWDEPRISTIETDVDDLQGRVQLLEEVEENDGVLVYGHFGETALVANENKTLLPVREFGADIISSNSIVIPDAGYYLIFMQGGLFTTPATYASVSIHVNNNSRATNTLTGSPTVSTVPQCSALLKIEKNDTVTFSIKAGADQTGINADRTRFAVMRAISNVGEIGDNWDEARIAAIENENLLQATEIADIAAADMEQNAKIEILENAVEALENAEPVEGWQESRVAAIENGFNFKTPGVIPANWTPNAINTAYVTTITPSITNGIKLTCLKSGNPALDLVLSIVRDVNTLYINATGFKYDVNEAADITIGRYYFPTSGFFPLTPWQSGGNTTSRLLYAPIINMVGGYGMKLGVQMLFVSTTNYVEITIPNRNNLPGDTTPVSGAFESYWAFPVQSKIGGGSFTVTPV